MIVLKSIIDGMQLISGGFIMNLVLFLTMLCLMLGRLPDYGPDDTERTAKSKWLYYGLLIYHLGFAIIRYLS